MSASDAPGPPDVAAAASDGTGQRAAGASAGVAIVRGLRVGLLLPAAAPPAWIAAAVARLVAAGAALVLAAAPARRAGGYGPGERLWLGLDRILTRPRPDPDAPRPLSAAPAAAADPWALLRGAGAQVVFCLGLPPPSPPSAAFPLGVWVLDPDGDGLAVAATARDEGALPVALVRADGPETGARLRPSWARVHRLSPAATRARALWRASLLPARALADLARGRAPEPPPGAWAATRPCTAVGPARVAARALHTGWRRLARRNDWFLAFELEPPEPVPADLARLTAIPAPQSAFWADPFPVVDGDRCCLFVEEWPRALGRGLLAAVEVDRQGRWRRLGTVLERPYHLSHPFVFDWAGERFLLPETAANGTLELYRCQRYPLEWTLEAVLMSRVRVVDATLHAQDGRWWLFANLADPPHAASHEELHLFHADSPLGPWEPHPANPICSDPRRARPAGRLFPWRGRLCRPAQDCGVRYGRAVVICQVEELSTARYAERPVARLEPEALAGANRLHTLNSTGWITVVDGHRDGWRRPR